MQAPVSANKSPSEKPPLRPILFINNDAGKAHKRLAVNMHAKGAVAHIRVGASITPTRDEVVITREVADSISA